MPVSSAIAIVYEAERTVKFVVIDSSKRGGNISLSESGIVGLVITENSNLRLGNHVANAKTMKATTPVRSMYALFLNTVVNAFANIDYFACRVRSMICLKTE